MAGGEVDRYGTWANFTVVLVVVVIPLLRWRSTALGMGVRTASRQDPQPVSRNARARLRDRPTIKSDEQTHQLVASAGGCYAQH
jgi:hypothetical protein